MSSIIASEKIQNHNVGKYNFKVLSLGSEVLEEPEESMFATKSTPMEQESKSEREVDTSQISQSSKDSLIESLLNKTDEMSSNFIKLQMKLENMADEHKIELKKAQEESYSQGVEDARAAALKDEDKNISNAISQYAISIQKLQSSAKEFDNALEEIKKDLISAALDISKEVIKVELGENSAKVAASLAQELIKDLQASSNIILKVNPKDHGAISQVVGSLSHVEVLSDGAVSLGGVIAISDAGNIDAQISKRFERVKRAALSE